MAKPFIKPTVRVVEKNQKFMKMIKEHKELRQLGLKVGFFGEGSPKTNYAARAAVLNNGSVKRNIPPRPFMNGAWENNLKHLTWLFNQQYLGFIKDKIKAKDFYLALGLMHKMHIQNSINYGNWEPVAPMTQERKGPSKTKPLIDKGILINKVKHKIEKTGSK